MFEITDVKLKKIEEKSNLLAIANITLNNCFVIKNLKIVKGKERVFLQFPTIKNKEGKFTDTCHPLNLECRKYFEDTILSKFYKSIGE